MKIWDNLRGQAFLNLTQFLKTVFIHDILTFSAMLPLEFKINHATLCNKIPMLGFNKSEVSASELLGILAYRLTKMAPGGIDNQYSK